MKLLIACMKCLEEFGKPTGEFSRVEFCDDGRYEITCSNGHETITVLQQQKFEVLFEIGAHAILDGYYREAVSSFTSSLERFHEFCIKVFFETGSISEKVLKSCWKKVSNQSERQLGAYIFLWTYCTKECPDTLSNNHVELRNAVVHKGKIPTKQEALEYGNAILDQIRPKMQLLQDSYSEEVGKVVFKHLRDSQKGTDIDKQISTMCLPTIISLSTGEKDHHSKSLEELLERLQKWKTIINNQ